MTRQRRRFDRDVRVARKAADVGEFDERKVATRVNAERQMVDDQAQPGMMLPSALLFSSGRHQTSSSVITARHCPICVG